MRYPLPYAFARSAGLLLEDDGQALTLWHNGQPEGAALGEVMRRCRIPDRATSSHR